MTDMGRRPDHNAAERAELSRIASEIKGRIGGSEMEKRLGIDQTTIDRWIANTQGISVANAHRLRDLAQEISGAVSTTVESAATQGGGLAMALTLLHGREQRGLLFPTLALCVEGNRRTSAAKRRPWSEAAIVAAAAGAAGDSDLAFDEWADRLDELEAFFERMRAVAKMRHAEVP